MDRSCLAQSLDCCIVSGREFRFTVKTIGDSYGYKPYRDEHSRAGVILLIYQLTLPACRRSFCC